MDYSIRLIVSHNLEQVTEFDRIYDITCSLHLKTMQVVAEYDIMWVLKPFYGLYVIGNAWKPIEIWILGGGLEIQLDGLEIQNSAITCNNQFLCFNLFLTGFLMFFHNFKPSESIPDPFSKKKFFFQHSRIINPCR